MTRSSFAQRQSGVVLFIALIVLVAMTFAGLAVMRSVGTGVLIASNLAFKQTTIAGAERGVEKAKDWLVAQSGGTLDSDDSTNGYYSSYGTFDPLTFNWNSGAITLAADAAGNTVRYVAHRLCQVANASVNATSQNCVMHVVTSGSTGGSSGGVGYGTYNLTTKVAPYYRVTVRSDGPKNSVSYVQVLFD